MKKSEISIVAFMLAFCGFFYYETVQLPPDAQSYPKFVIGLLTVLTVLQLVKMVVGCHGKLAILNDDAEVWKGFLPKQFFTFFGGCILFFILMYFLGFYPASLLFLIGMLKYFHIENKLILLTLVVMLVMIYVVFTTFLNVPLPEGELLGEFL